LFIHYNQNTLPMKNTLLLLLFVAATFTITSCAEGEERFEVPITLSGFNNVTLNDDFDWKTFSIEVVTNEIESALNDFGYSLNQVKKIEAKNMSITITTPNVTFDNIMYLEAYVEADQIDEVKVAYLTEIPDGATTANLENQYSDITNILKQPSFTFYVRAYNEVNFGPATGTISFTVDVIAEK